ncbi:MAG: triphosphoribosyl-dephospho-CoA synthase [Methylotenera sp.]
MTKQLTPEQLAKAYQWACMTELQAIKPGNVHVFADGHGMTIHDFVKSADATAAVIAKPNLSVGERIFNAVEATQQAVGLNTNLGLILLCAPLIHAASNDNAGQVATKQTLQQNLSATLSELTVNDAFFASKAIVLANPAGLGSIAQYDVHEKPSVTLLEMMRSAQDRDRIAWQYVNAYQDVMEFGLARYSQAMEKWQNQAWSTTALYLGFLARQIDTHVVRKYGEAVATGIMAEAKDVEEAYWATDNPKLVQQKLLDWDKSLKIRNINPGTSADLTVACLLATFLV